MAVDEGEGDIATRWMDFQDDAFLHKFVRRVQESDGLIIESPR